MLRRSGRSGDRSQAMHCVLDTGRWRDGEGSAGHVSRAGGAGAPGCRYVTRARDEGARASILAADVAATAHLSSADLWESAYTPTPTSLHALRNTHTATVPTCADVAKQRHKIAGDSLDPWYLWSVDSASLRADVCRAHAVGDRTCDAKARGKWPHGLEATMRGACVWR
jgi:hypothetical protein